MYPLQPFVSFINDSHQVKAIIERNYPDADHRSLNLFFNWYLSQYHQRFLQFVASPYGQPNLVNIRRINLQPNPMTGGTAGQQNVNPPVQVAPHFQAPQHEAANPTIFASAQPNHQPSFSQVTTVPNGFGQLRETVNPSPNTPFQNAAPMQRPLPPFASIISARQERPIISREHNDGQFPLLVHGPTYARGEPAPEPNIPSGSGTIVIQQHCSAATITTATTLPDQADQASNVSQEIFEAQPVYTSNTSSTEITFDASSPATMSTEAIQYDDVLKEEIPPAQPMNSFNTLMTDVNVFDCGDCAECNRLREQAKQQIKEEEEEEKNVPRVDQQVAVEPQSSILTPPVLCTSEVCTFAQRTPTGPRRISINQSLQVSANSDQPNPVIVPKRSTSLNQECCGQLFRSFAALKRHRKSFHQAEQRIQPQSNYRCTWNGCSMQSHYRWSVICHVRRLHFQVPPSIKAQFLENRRETKNPALFVAPVV